MLWLFVCAVEATEPSYTGLAKPLDELEGLRNKLRYCLKMSMTIVAYLFAVDKTKDKDNTRLKTIETLKDAMKNKWWNIGEAPEFLLQTLRVNIANDD